MIFPAVMYGCETWIIKKAEHQRIDALELWCWRRLLRVPWPARRSNQSILKETNPEWIFIRRTDTESEASILWPPDAKIWFIRKGPDAGKDWRREEKGRQRLRWVDGSLTRWTWVWASSGKLWRTRKPGVLQSMGSQRVKRDRAI